MRLIDADELINAFRYADESFGMMGMLPIIEQAIEHQPTYNPWRRIDDVEELADGEQVIVTNWSYKDIAMFDGDDNVINCHDIYTHYMVIPEVQNEG
jgi:hypothetical protein